MKIKLIGSAVGEADGRQYCMSFIVNDTIAVDAGSIGFVSPLDVQRRIQHVLLTHSHLDHIASLPIFLDNIYEPGPDCPTLYGSRATLDCLQKDIFNERVWPDVLRLSREETPFLRLQELQCGQAVELDGIMVTPIALDHVVPVFGYILDDGKSAVGIVTDTLPTQAIWQRLNDTANLTAVFVEASFPNEMQWLADQASHLTPNTLRGELEKLQHDVPVYAIHLKPDYHDQLVGELTDLKLPNLQIVEPGRTYDL